MNLVKKELVNYFIKSLNCDFVIEPKVFNLIDVIVTEKLKILIKTIVRTSKRRNGNILQKKDILVNSIVKKKKLTTMLKGINVMLKNVVKRIS